VLSLGIVGLPNVGKSTLFNALTRGRAQVANYPFTTIDPNMGVVEVPDDRLAQVARLAGAEKVTPTAVQFVDIAGLVKGASRGEGLGNKFLSHIREVDAVAHVVRCFRDPNVAHVDGALDPVRDMDVVETELILADLDTVGRRIAKTEPMLKTGDKRYRFELDTLTELQGLLDSGRPAREMDLPFERRQLVESLFLLTMKPMMIIANLPEECADRVDGAVAEIPSRAGVPVIPVCAELERQLSELEPEDARAYLASLGLEHSALDNVVTAGYRLLDLITFFTMKGPETRAWTVPLGTSAPKAAGKVHTDMERGFIRAEVIQWDLLLQEGSFGAAREHGRVRTEGKDYVIQDGDVILFRFNV
jgi:GTP-binding protein YchF